MVVSCLWTQIGQLLTNKHTCKERIVPFQLIDVSLVDTNILLHIFDILGRDFDD